MPIRIDNDLPAKAALEEENVFVMDKERACTQDIRPLKIAILNLMPNKLDTELHLLRSLSNTPLQLDITFLQTESYVPTHVSESHMEKFYNYFSEIKDKRFDGLIITGAPVELKEFEEVDYWDEICKIMEWSKRNVFSTLHICWGAQAGLYYHFGIQKQSLPEKLFGVFPHKRDYPHAQIIKGFDDVFMVPHSRHTTFNRSDIEKIKCLQIITSSEQAGVHIVANKNGRQFFITGHSEYDRNTLAEEYFRDKEKGLNIHIPYNYFPDDDPKKRPIFSWKSHANLLFSNWVNYCIYQCTPYDLTELEVRNWEWEAGI